MSKTMQWQELYGIESAWAQNKHCKQSQEFGLICSRWDIVHLRRERRHALH